MTVRIGIALTKLQHERLRTVVLRLQTTQTKLVAAMTSVMSDAELKTLLDRYDRLVEIEREIRKVADANMLQYIKGRSVEELQQMLEAARAAGHA